MAQPPDLRFIDVLTTVKPIHNGAELLEITQPNGTIICVLLDEYTTACTNIFGFDGQQYVDAITQENLAPAFGTFREVNL